MTEEHTISVRASAAPRMSICQDHWEWEQENQPPAETVGLRIGQIVHNAVTGHQIDDSRPVLYNSQTPNAKALDRAVESAKRRFAAWFDEYAGEDGYVDQREKALSVRVSKDGMDFSMIVSGHVDMVIRRSDGSNVLLDLKTGASPPAGVMLQVAVYCWLWEKSGESEECPVSEGGFVYVPRKEGSEVLYSTQDFGGLVEAGSAWVEDQLRRLYRGSLPTPGLHCAMCQKPDCIMRAIPSS